MTGMEDLLHFDDVDATADQRAFIDFLDRVDALPDVAAYRAVEVFAAAGCVVDVGWSAAQRTRARDGTWLVSFTFLATTATAP